MKNSFTFFVLVISFLWLSLASVNVAQDKKPKISSNEPPLTTTSAEPSILQAAEIYKINPTPESSSSSKVYIPVSLEDSFAELSKMLDPRFVEKFKKGGEDEVVSQHFGLGLWMRNNWRLWGGSRLAKYFNNLEIFHPDDMSGIILTSFQRHLNAQPLEIEEQTKRYKEYWEKSKRNDSKPKKKTIKKSKS